MTRLRAMLAKELVALWSSPLPYVVGALFNAVLGVLFIDQLRAREQAVVQPLFPIAGFLLLALIPLLTMRTLAEERRLGTLDVLQAVPVPAAPIVAGKWLAAWLTVVVTVAPSSLLAGLLLVYGEPDTGPMVSGYVGLALLAVAVTGVGVLASALTATQPVAAVGAFFAVLVLWFAHAGSGSVTTGAFLAHLSLSERLRTFAEGGIGIADAGFLVTLGGLALLAATVAVAARRPGIGGRGRRWGTVALVAVTLLCVERVTDRVGPVIDLTSERTLSLTSTTKQIVAAVDEPVEVTAFVRRDQPGRVEAVTLLDRYRRLNRRISYRVLDPEGSPGELRRLGVDPVTGGVAVAAGEQVEVVPTASEQDLTTALARLQRNISATVCVATGHGELSLGSTSSTGFSAAGDLLRENGYDLTEVDLLAESAVPSSCDALVVAFPTSDLGPRATAVSDHLERGGRLLLLADPDGANALDAVLRPYGLTLEPGVVLEGDPSAAFGGDPAAPIVSRYSSANPVVRNLAPTFFPTVMGVEVDDEPKVDGLTTSRLADTSPDSYLERSSGTAVFDEGMDLRGPVTVAAAADLSRVRGTEITRTRIVVVGDADFASNALLGEAGNAALLVQAVDWLAVDENLVAVTANLARPRPLELTSSRRSYALFLSVGVVPGLFILAGALVWALRRNR